MKELMIVVAKAMPEHLVISELKKAIARYDEAELLKDEDLIIKAKSDIVTASMVASIKWGTQRTAEQLIQDTKEVDDACRVMTNRDN